MTSVSSRTGVPAAASLSLLANAAAVSSRRLATPGASPTSTASDHLSSRVSTLEDKVAELARVVDWLAVAAPSPPTGAGDIARLALPQVSRKFDRPEHVGSEGETDGDTSGSTSSNSCDDVASPGSAFSNAKTIRRKDPATTLTGYEFAGSVWDTVICVGHPFIGIGGSLLSLFLILINMVVQVVFCNIVRTAFTKNPYDAEIHKALFFWRTGEGHSSANVDRTTMTSLVERVCHFDEALPNSFAQRNRADDIDEYGVSLSTPGGILCSLALLCWYLIITAELNKVVTFVTGVLRKTRPRGKTIIIEDHDGCFIVQSIAPARAVFVLAVQSVRLFIALALGYYGNQFLIYTQSLEDLMLNAVALEFILNIDELFFSAAATDRMQRLIHNLKPLPLKRFPEVSGANLGAILMSVLPLVLCCISVITCLIPSLTERKAAWDAVCGGKLNFAVATDGLGRVHWSPTTTYGSVYVGKQDYVRKAVDKLIWDDNSTSDNSMYEHSLEELIHEVSSQTVAEAAQIAQCKDADSGIGMHWAMGVDILKSENFDKTLVNCTSVTSHCQSLEMDGIRARQWCPVTCGCQTWRSGLLMDDAASGCPTSCKDSYFMTLPQLGCDPFGEKSAPLALKDELMAYAAGLKALFGQVGAFHTPFVDLADDIVARGCTAVDEGGHLGAELCDGKVTINGTTDRHFRPIDAFCPVACGCDGSGKPGSKVTLTGWNATKVHTVLSLRGSCSRPFSIIDQDYFFIGMTENEAPLYRSPSGVYIFYGPDCRQNQGARRWTISPTPCVAGYYDGYVVTDQIRSPPFDATWHMSCDDGWRQVNISLTPRKD